LNEELTSTQPVFAGLVEVFHGTNVLKMVCALSKIDFLCNTIVNLPLAKDGTYLKDSFPFRSIVGGRDVILDVVEWV
jgi:hypothetical protein